MCAEKCAQYRSRHRARAWGRVGDGHGAAIGSEAAAVREEIRQMGGRAGLDHRWRWRSSRRRRPGRDDGQSARSPRRSREQR